MWGRPSACGGLSGRLPLFNRLRWVSDRDDMFAGVADLFRQGLTKIKIC